jgi:hypothetical protein
MADYYPLLTRALDALTERSPAMRRAVYDRARAALMDQLRNLEPPLSEGDIARERLALEDAVNRVESEQRRRESFADVISTAVLEPAGRPVPEPPPPAPPPPDEEARPPFRPPPAMPDPAVEDREPADRARLGEPGPRERPRIDTVSPRVAPSGRGRTAILAAALAVAIGLIAAAAYVLRDRPADLPRQPVVAEAPQAGPADSKIGDRVAGERAPGTPGAAAPVPAAPGATAPRGDVAVAQRAMLYEENQADPQTPKVTPARAVWRLDNLNAGQGQPLETVVRATVDVPDAKLSLSLILRRNPDQTLPASHTVELAFTTPPGDPGRAVRDVGLLQFKNDETVRGTPVSGLPVPVKENLFLIGLSNLASDVDRNTDLITRRNWIDLPIRFSSGQRAILSFEKGVSGEQLVNEAFRQWRQQ